MVKQIAMTWVAPAAAAAEDADSDEAAEVGDEDADSDVEVAAPAGPPRKKKKPAGCTEQYMKEDRDLILTLLGESKEHICIPGTFGLRLLRVLIRSLFASRENSWWSPASTIIAEGSACCDIELCLCHWYVHSFWPCFAK